MERISLIEPTIEYANDIMAYRQEFLDNNDSLDGSGNLRKVKAAEEWIKYCADCKNEETVPEGLVPADSYICVRESDNKIVGMIQVRHRLNEYLLNFAGHIGYSVRPNERRKGYAKEMLKQLLKLCKAKGLEKILLTCDEGNVASSSTIIANTGVYENKKWLEDESVYIERYWILL